MVLFLLALTVGVVLRLLLFRRLVFPHFPLAWPFFLALGWEAFWALLAYWGLVSPRVAGSTGQLGTYALLTLAFAANIRLPALWPALLGAVLNGLVIFANGGHMPVEPEALRRAGLEHLLPFLEASRDGLHVLAHEGTRLRALGDWIPLPGKVVSPGDLLLVLSLVLVPIFPYPLRPGRST